MSNLIIANNCHTHCFTYYFETLQTTASITEESGGWNKTSSTIGRSNCRRVCSLLYNLFCLSDSWEWVLRLVSQQQVFPISLRGIFYFPWQWQTPDRKDQQSVVSVLKDTHNAGWNCPSSTQQSNQYQTTPQRHRDSNLSPSEGQPCTLTTGHCAPVHHWPLDHCAPYV